MLSAANYFTLSQRKKEGKGGGIPASANVCIATVWPAQAVIILVCRLVDLDLKGPDSVEGNYFVDLMVCRRAACAISPSVGWIKPVC